MAEELICGVVEIKGGDFEWICVKPPHGPRRVDGYYHQGESELGNHYFKAFKKSREKQALE